MGMKLKSFLKEGGPGSLLSHKQDLQLGAAQQWEDPALANLEVASDTLYRKPSANSVHCWDSVPQSSLFSGGAMRLRFLWQ